MFGIGGSVRIYYCPTPINLRKSFDGLAGAVEEYIKQDPESGHVFAFFSRNKKLVKLSTRPAPRAPPSRLGPRTVKRGQRRERM